MTAPTKSPLFPYTTLFRSRMASERVDGNDVLAVREAARRAIHRARVERLPTLLEAVSFRLRGHSVVDPARYRDRKSTRLNSSHVEISYAVFCLKKKKEKKQ